MNFDEIEILLKKYGWLLESKSPFEISSLDGEHRASNFAAEVVTEWFAFVDAGSDENEKESLQIRFGAIKKD